MPALHWTRTTFVHRATRLVIGAAALAAFVPMTSGAPAAAVVYCTGPGVPRGCVVAPAPAARAAVYCTRPGYPVGCVGSPAARAVGAPGPGVSPVNRGGPVNRIGVR